MDLEIVIDTALKPFVKSTTRREEATEAVYGALKEAGAKLEEIGTVAEVAGARVAVRTIEAYGLVIELDAVGNAVTVSSEYGLEVIEA